MKKYFIIPFLVFPVLLLQAQQKPAGIDRFADVTITAGKSQGAIAAAFVNNWKFGKHKRLAAGIGVRYTAYTGVKTNFITAPARLARTSTTPVLIVFAGQRKDYQDTLTVQRPLTHSLNATINLGYYFNTHWDGGFNIDLVGFTIGRNTSAILTSNGNTRIEPNSKPAGFNLLLTGDHDYGTLNSEFFVRYKLNKKWGIKAVYQFLFIEYKTSSIKQTSPDGTIVTRFRNKANDFGIGGTYHF